MQKKHIKDDITVLYVTASTFPEGIQEAFDKLHSILPNSPSRIIFGLSRPENGGEIIYRAAAEELSQGEAEQLGCERLTIKRGNYISLTVNEFKRNISSIGKAFEKLLTVQNLDPNGYCIEVYDPNEEGYDTERESVICMVKLKD